MVHLYQFAPVWGIPNLSSFCVKVETYLRMVNLPYEKHNALPLSGPKGKLPYIEVHGEKISDSRFIIDYLKKTYGDTLDRDLTPEQKAVSNAMQRLVEDDLYWVAMYFRWGKKDANWEENRKAIFSGLPPLLRSIIPTIARQGILKQIHGQGMGRHSEEEILHIGRTNLVSLSDFLADKPYFMGDKPTTLDASAFGLLVNILQCPIESPLKEHAKHLGNLVAFCDRIKQKYYMRGTSQHDKSVKVA